ncbi:hypothetical protein J7M02_04235, partial [Candidatus Aerophobetes bacterium]|nr:hypothetical protein [Candidatus Aerophobetes bacterium]
MILILVFIGIGAYLLVGYFRSRGEDYHEDTAAGWLVCSIIWWSIGLVILLVVFAITNADISMMKTFQSTNKRNLEILAEETRRLSDISSNTTLSLEKFQLYGEVGKRLAELTQQVNKYNKDLSVYRMYK